MSLRIAFVTGASGFIGSHLIDALLKNGWRIRVLSHRSPILQEEKVEVFRGDIGDAAVLRVGLEGTDALFHLASSLGASLIDREDFRRINALGTENVMRAAREASVRRVIHFSSAGVLGAVKDGDIASEDYPTIPKTIYDKTKLEGEEIARCFAQQGLNLTIIRPGWTYGPRDKRTLKLIKAIQKRQFFLVAKGKGRQTPVHVQDLVKGALLCAERGRRGEIYHIAGREILTVGEMAEAIGRTLGTRFSRFNLPAGPARAAAFLLEKAFLPLKKEAPLTRSKLGFFLHSKPLSIRKAQEQLGYAPEIPFREGVQTTIAWYRDNGWL